AESVCGFPCRWFFPCSTLQPARIVRPLRGTHDDQEGGLRGVVVSLDACRRRILAAAGGRRCGSPGLMALAQKPVGGAQLDSAHVGDIRGGFGTILEHDVGPRKNWWARFKTLLAILGPGLIVMVGDNDAGAFGTYTQAGQNYGTTLLWTLLMLIPVLYVNQEMVLRLGAVTGVGHARLILERFGKFWGAFSVIDLLVLNALTIVTEFIGLTLGFDYLGIPKLGGVVVSALIIMGAASTGDIRRFERFSLALVFSSLLLLPVFFMAHPLMGQLSHDFLVPGFPKNGALGDVMLLIIAIVGT